MEDARLIALIGRQALVTLSFDIDQSGQPVNFRIETVTDPFGAPRRSPLFAAGDSPQASKMASR